MKPIQYKGHWITRTFPSGYYEAYIGGHFNKADTLQGIKTLIDHRNNPPNNFFSVSAI